MAPAQKLAALTCLNAAEEGTLDFPQIIGALMDAGFESYTVDFRRTRSIYYLADGQSIELPAHPVATPIAAAFDTGALQAAIREAQTKAPGYTYKGFCEKAAAAGCAAYTVSFPGRRAVYSGRTAEAHVEHFPG